jgi:hypothetical protein
MKYENYKDYKFFLTKWRAEIIHLRRTLFNVGLTKNEKAYIRGQISAIEQMCNTLTLVFI